MTPPRAVSAEQELTPEQVAATLEAYLLRHPGAVVLEDGQALFDMRCAKYSLATEHGRCTLQVWSEERNIVRRVSGVAARGGLLRLTIQRFGQSRPSSLELVADPDRRPPSTREATRKQYLRTLERALLRGPVAGRGERWGEWKPEGFRTAMDLERSFGPAYARGTLVHGQQAWAVIGVNAAETQATVDGILTLGILWLAHCREHAGGRRLYRGLRVMVPRGMAALTASRLAWMNPDAAQWELWEFDEKTEELEQRDAADNGNLATRLVHAPNEITTRDRFAEATARVMVLVPERMRESVELRVRSGSEMAFLLHGLEFARARAGYAGQSFNRMQEITFGAGANEAELTETNATEMRELVARLFARRQAREADGRGGPDASDPLYRMQPERWLESVLRRNVTAIDERLDPEHVYTQVPAFAAQDRGMLDLLGVDKDGRLAVIELKADDDLQLALQGLDYWVRVRWHHLQNEDTAGRPSFGLGEFQRHGYFGGVRLSAEAPKLYLVAPALRVHPATEVVLRHLSPRVEWELVALNERWREQVTVVWRKRSGKRA